MAVSYAYGRTLAEQSRQARTEATARLAVDVVTSTRSSKNVIAEMPAGESDRRPGRGRRRASRQRARRAGLNDNGSGVAAILLAAARVAPEARNGPTRVRFALWGAEEIGLIGSRDHANRLSDEERKRIALYINLDMVGSPNFARFGLADPDADGAAGLAARTILDHFAGRSAPAAERRGTGPLGTFSTDTASSTGRGIPSIGLLYRIGGAEAEEQAAGARRTAGQPYDRAITAPATPRPT